METFILEHEPLLRMGAFMAVFGLMALWEIAAPMHTPKASRTLRWPSNFGITVLNIALVRVVFPASAVGMALYAQSHGLGLFNIVQVPYLVALLGAVLLLDLVIYFQHRVFHTVPLLWRLHRMHHADPAFDVSTATRFHPIEIFLSMLVKFAAILVIGPPALGVFLFELLLNLTATFNHANVRMPVGIDRVLRFFLVTPDMHRIHHSVIGHEHNSNFGFCLSIWDRLLGTYKAEPIGGQRAIRIGLLEISDVKVNTRFIGLLSIPFLSARPQKPNAENVLHTP